MSIPEISDQTWAVFWMTLSLAVLAWWYLIHHGGNWEHDEDPVQEPIGRSPSRIYPGATPEQRIAARLHVHPDEPVQLHCPYDGTTMLVPARSIHTYCCPTCVAKHDQAKAATRARRRVPAEIAHLDWTPTDGAA
ncbi:hypothetical protein [Arsenicicoccus dermatophilus]|uniref:hypothetical protein n=1 Tax=Arsenicicoccus dermatophilus TaxID=1076331 RepID=UPI001F4D15A7|nr:hypothetical protein [Arsenicicoccus dermatophilus]MCH8613432.1 hypothetical protein [Arsenicicoccus dermatophilus]